MELCEEPATWPIHVLRSDGFFKSKSVSKEAVCVHLFLYLFP